MGFFRKEQWSGLPSPLPGDLPDQGIKPGSPELQADSLLSEPPGKPYQFYSLQETQHTVSSKGLIAKADTHWLNFRDSCKFKSSNY